METKKHLSKLVLLVRLLMGVCLNRMEQQSAHQSEPGFLQPEMFQPEGEAAALQGKKQPVKKKRRHQVAKVKGNWSDEEDARLVG